MSITYGDHLIDSGYYDITPEQECEIEARFIPCEVCQTEGRIYRSNGGPDDIDYGICPACNGECVVEVETESASLDDWECEDCIGMKDHGCYCKAMGAVGPGGPLPSKGNGSD